MMGLAIAGRGVIYAAGNDVQSDRNGIVDAGLATAVPYILSCLVRQEFFRQCWRSYIIV